MTDRADERRRRPGVLGVGAAVLLLGGAGAWALTSLGGDSAPDPGIAFEAVTAPAVITAPPGAATTAPPTSPAPSTSASSPTSTTDPATESTDAGASDPATTASDPAAPTSVPASTVVPGSSTTAPATPTTSPIVASTAPAADAPPPVVATIEDGKLVVRGAVRDLPSAKQLLDDLIFRSGSEVVNMLTVDPAVPETLTVPLFVPGAALFEADGATLGRNSERALQIVGGLVASSPGQKLIIRGHTDDVGPDDYNFALSQQRIAAVFAYLQRQGVSPDAMQLEPRGETEPIADNSTSTGRALNRRVELILVPA